MYVDGQCVSLDAGLGSIPTVLLQTALIRAEKVNGVWKMVFYSRDAATETFTQLRATPLPLANYPFCDEDAAFSDGLVVGWLLGAVIVAAWGYRVLRGLVR